MNRRRIFVAFLLVFLTGLYPACQKPERNNPWDEKSKQGVNEWSPIQIEIEFVSFTERKLKWQYHNLNIEGFRIDRKIDGENWIENFAIIDKSNNYWIDTLISPVDSLKYSYRLYAFAGKNKSDFLEISFYPEVIPAPSDISISFEISTCKLNWKDNCHGESGYKVEKRINKGEWIKDYAILPANAESYEDNDIFSLKNEVIIEYKVFAFVKGFSSEAVFAEVVSYIHSPINMNADILGESLVMLKWDYDYTYPDGFIIEKKINDDEWFVWKIISINSKTVVDSTVQLFTNTYFYRVIAYKSNIRSNSSNEISVYGTIGTIAHGGIVFFLDGTGHGLVCAEYDQTASANWGCFGTLIGSTSMSFGTGYDNMVQIVSICNENSFAAKVSDNLIHNGYNDWYLPSATELKTIYQNLKTIGIGNFSNFYYWSSSEYDSSEAWIVRFDNGNLARLIKNNQLRVRSIRAF